MHRVDADGYTTVGGERRFIDRAMPTEEGTIDGAYWNNAIQEEIAQVVEHAGLTLASSGSADQTAGWGQLKEAIFLSNAIDSAAINNITLSKISAGNATLEDSRLQIMSNAIPSYVQMTQAYQTVQYGDPSANQERQIDRSGWGDTYTRGTSVRGDALASTSNDGTMSFDISAYTWTLSGGAYYTAIINRNTGLQWAPESQLSTYPVTFASVVGNSGSTMVKTLTVNRLNMDEVFGKIRIQTLNIVDTGIDPNTLDNLKLFIRFCEYQQ